MNHRTPNALRRPFELVLSAVLVLVVLTGCGDGDEEGETVFEDVEVTETTGEADVAAEDVDIAETEGDADVVAEDVEVADVGVAETEGDADVVAEDVEVADVDVAETVEDGEVVADATEPLEADIPDVADEVAATPSDRVVAVADATPGDQAREVTPTPAIVVSTPPAETVAEVPTEAATPAGPAQAATPGVAGAAQEPLVDEETPAAPGDAAVSAIDEALAVAESCTVEGFPPFEGDVPVQVTTTEVNFRAGPGTDCELLSEPLPPGTTVEVLSEPVSREGRPDFEWVAVSVDGVEGWIATDFIEPAP